jgi:hypothetical protein
VFQSKGLSVQAKLAVFKGAVLSSLLYGAETWAIKQGHLHLLEGFVATCLRQIMRQPVTKRMPDFVLFREAQLAPIDLTIQRMRLRWLGHVARMNDERMPKWLLYGELTDVPDRPACKPKQRWIDVVDRDLQQTGLKQGLKSLEWQKMALNRTRWRGHVDKHFIESRGRYFEKKQHAREVRKGQAVGRFECPVAGCTFTHDQMRYVKSHVKQKHTEAAQMRRVERVAQMARRVPDSTAVFLCPVCQKSLKRDTTNPGAQWKGFRIHLVKAHKITKAEQDTLIEQLGGVPT